MEKLEASAPSALIARAGQQSLIGQIDPKILPEIVIFLEDSKNIVCDQIANMPSVSVIHGSTPSETEQQALIELERRLRPNSSPRINSGSGHGSVVLVGAGVVNLITALELRRANYDVTVLDRMPDPLSTDSFNQFATGATFAGMDARIFSLNESRHHLFRGLTSPSKNTNPFSKRVSDHGWLSRDLDVMDQQEKSWVSRLESVPSWLASIYNNDTIAYNRTSAEAWSVLFSLYPQILRGVNYNTTLLRVYQTPENFEKAQRLERNLGACIEVISKDQLAKRQPSFASAANSGAIAGALHVEGFSLNIKSFSRNLIRLLLALDVEFHWNCSLNTLRTDAQGRVSGLMTDDEVVMADNVVLCPGAYAGLSSSALPALSEIASMAGMWITLPNEETPLTAPLKVRRRGFAASEAAEGANIIPGHDAQSRPVIYCSSGHGFVGSSPEAARQSNLYELLECIKETTAELFPDKFREAERRGLLSSEPEYCIRPWTSSGLGVFDTRELANGGQLILTGGHNTGGFAQAPAVARSVLAALDGTPHCMASIYHPERASALLA
ncbi:NAD(P)/FAD-dependent oxidoreductase [Parasedimentitalea maritima]|uniref:NAD(P)/FAD-dependent oxidoreductase n=1 Tax=Parasedimentitalea maritima TaxID=2578117 RepID=UPI001BB1DACF|nr:FAD-dependent oxidoreductase [Zongyanglinia marina]